MEFSVNVFKK